MQRLEKYWRDKLLCLQQELEDIDAESREGRNTVELDQSSVGRLSRMDAMQRQEMNKAIAARRHQSLRRIIAALDRLEEGEFGYCLKCGEEIAPARLELDPTTLYCTGCNKSA